MRIAIAQLDSAPGNVEADLSRVRKIVAEARAGGADLVVFPGLFLTGYLHIPGCEDLAIADDDSASSCSRTGGRKALVPQSGFQVPGGRPARAPAQQRRLPAGRKGLPCPPQGRPGVLSPVPGGSALQPRLGHPAFDTPWARMEILICNDAWQPGFGPVGVARRRREMPLLETPGSISCCRS